MPIIFVANVQASAEFFRDTLGFSIDFLHGHPPFYGAVSRDGACVHLKFVHEPVFAIGTHDRDGFIMAFIEVENVKALYAEYLAAGVRFDQKLKKQAWGGRDFIVRDLDGNGICFRRVERVTHQVASCLMPKNSLTFTPCRGFLDRPCGSPGR